MTSSSLFWTLRLWVLITRQTASELMLQLELFSCFSSQMKIFCVKFIWFRWDKVNQKKLNTNRRFIEIPCSVHVVRQPTLPSLSQHNHLVIKTSFALPCHDIFDLETSHTACLYRPNIYPFRCVGFIVYLIALYVSAIWRENHWNTLGPNNNTI